MKVFLGWSGQRSKEVAEALREWLPDVLHSVSAFISIDIEKGRDFFGVLRTELAGSNFGIVCLTMDNCRSPWLLFESGALAKVVESSWLCPYLIDMEPLDLPAPLGLFQAASSDEKGTLDLVRSLNSASDSIILSEQQIQKSFGRWWPDLKPKLESKSKPLGPPAEANFILTNLKSGSVLRAAGLPHKNGEPLEVAAYSGDEQEMWHFHQFQKKYYAIVSAYTGQCLDVDGDSTVEAAKIHQWDFRGHDNQKWILVLQDDGSYKVKGKHSGLYLADTGAGIKQMGDNPSRDQKWLVTPVFGS